MYDFSARLWVQNLNHKAHSFDYLLLELHAVSDYKKRLCKKRPVEFKETKKRRLVSIYKAKKRNQKNASKCTYNIKFKSKILLKIQ